MTTIQTPRIAAAEVARTPTLPTGPDETVTGFGVMGLPFASGHYLALRDFPAASFLPGSVPGYRSVWHRDPDGAWTFYATTPAEHSCARYFSSATANDAVVCPVDVTWTGDYTLVVDIPDVLRWTIGLHDTAATRLLTTIGSRLPDGVWTSPGALGAIGRCAGALLGAGQVRLAGTMPNGQNFRIAPRRMWAVRSSRAVLDGRDLGAIRRCRTRRASVTSGPPNGAWRWCAPGNSTQRPSTRCCAPSGTGSTATIPGPTG